MKRKGRVIALFMSLALVVTGINVGWQTDTVKGADISKKGYTISKSTGTYNESLNVKLKVKKGYKLYYTTNGKFKAKKVIKSRKTKTVKISKTTTLSVYAIKKNKKITVKKINKIAKKKGKSFAKYKYIIKKKSQEQSTTKAAENVSETTTTKTSGEATTKADDTTKTEETTKTSEEVSKIRNQLKEEESTASLAAENADSQKPEEVTLPDDLDENTAQKVVLTNTGASMSNMESDSSVSYTSASASKNDMATLTVSQPGTYIISGGSESDPLVGVNIEVKKNTGDVILVWDNLYIDNSSFGDKSGQDNPVFAVKSGDKTTNRVTVLLKGTSVLKGNGRTYTDENNEIAMSGGVIEAKGSDTILTFVDLKNGNLTVEDSMDRDSTDFGTNDPSDGISCKGSLIIQSGKINVVSNGDCLKGIGSDGNGGVFVLKGEISLKSLLGNGLKSKNGNINIYNGNLDISYTKADGINAKNYYVNILGGKITIDNCYGDGIQGENVVIAGDNTEINITTAYENAGKNFYSSSLGTGNYNTMSESNSTKTEVVNVDPGSHKGIKAGTKACTYSYKSVTGDSTDTDGNTLEAGKTYTTEASGGLIIAGGTIVIDTTATGIKYNGGGNGGRATSNITAATNDGKYIIGAPDDAIHSNNSATILNADITVSAADDGITCAENLAIMDGTNIDIKTAYEGIEAGTITVGDTNGIKEPEIVIYSNDDGVNAAKKKNVNYVYEDENEEKYTKTSVSASDNTFEIISGYLNVMIADDESHTITLPVENGTDTTITYSADGDGIDCNGSFYAYGGTVIVFGTTSNDNSPIDTDSTYYIGSGATILAVGSSGMIENPTKTDQTVLCTSETGGNMSGNNGNSGGPGGNRPGGNGGPGGNPGQMGNSSTYDANTAFGIVDGNNNTILSICPNKKYSYVLYTSPKLTAGTTYSMYSGGSVSGNKLTSSSYDFRYASYDVTNATLVKTIN